MEKYQQHNGIDNSSKNISQHNTENLLIMQGGGSLGAYECGVFKVLAKHKIKFDIISGVSIGAVNGAIIAAGLRRGGGPQSIEQQEIQEDVAKTLENFWLEIADTISPTTLPYKIRSSVAAAHSMMHGNSKAFIPIMVMPGIPAYYFPFDHPYFYSTEELKRTLNKYVDFKVFANNNKSDTSDKSTSNNVHTNSETNNQDDRNDAVITTPRLILNCTDMQRGKLVTFDSQTTNITADHIAACTGYPFYGIAWSKINDSYLVDGSLLNNTPLRSAIKASPKNEKIVYVCDIFGREQEQLPTNFLETWHRARDLLFVEKIQPVTDLSDVIKEYLPLLEEMYNILSNPSAQIDQITKGRFAEIQKDCENILQRRGTMIKDIITIRRTEYSHRYLLEDANFSIDTIKELIRQGEKDAESALAERNG